MGRLSIVISRFGIGLQSMPSKVKHVSYPPVKPTAPPKGKNMTYPTAVDEASIGRQARTGNKVMVVVDSRLDSEGALEWTLTRAVQDQHDCIVLLHVVKPFNIDQSEYSRNFNLRAHEILRSMRNMCKARRPSVRVEMATMQGERKEEVIVEEAKRQKVNLLVLGKKRRWRSGMCSLVSRLWPGKRRQDRIGAVEYCIQNAACMAIAVRRKSRRLGGYLITTKSHKNFWLLA